MSTPIRILPARRGCVGNCRQGRDTCPPKAECAGWLTDANLACEVTWFERNAAVPPLGEVAQARPQAEGLIGRLKAWLASRGASRRIEPAAGSIADVIALENWAGAEVHITGMELEHCQKNVRQKARLVAGLKKDGAA